VYRYHAAVRSELDLTQKKIDSFMSGNKSESSFVDELNQKIVELQKTMDDQVGVCEMGKSCDLRTVEGVVSKVWQPQCHRKYVLYVCRLIRTVEKYATWRMP